MTMRLSRACQSQRQPCSGANRQQARGHRRLQLLAALLFGLLSYLFFSQCVMSTVEVSGLSMAPTLQNGDLFLLDRWSHWVRDPHRGDLVVIRDPSRWDYVVKRVVALPREFVQMQRNIAYINGRRLMEPYLPLSALATQDAVIERPFAVPPDHYFVMGDNRSNSEDSRHYGAVPRQNIVGFLQIGPQPEAFVRTPVKHASLLPLPTISASATERTSPAPIRQP